MGPQDGVDLAMAAADVIVNRFGRTDVAFTFMGSGDCHDELVRQRDAAGLGDVVDLPGRVPDSFVADVLSTAAVGLSPDPLNPLNEPQPPGHDTGAFTLTLDQFFRNFDQLDSGLVRKTQ